MTSTHRAPGSIVVMPDSTTSITTDKTDYVPGETVTITGSGFGPAETVMMELSEDPANNPTYILTAVTDTGGNFTNSDFIVRDSDVGVTFFLSATGRMSGLAAATTFMNRQSAFVAFNAFGIPAGTPVTVSWQGTNNGGNPSNGSVTFNSPGSGFTGGLGPLSTFTYSFPSTLVSGAYVLSSTSPASGFATGASGSTTTVSATYIAVDTTPPEISVSNVTAEAASASGSFVTYSASAIDSVDGAVAVACSPGSGSLFALGATTVICSALDSHNNTAKKSFTVTVVDTTPPVVSAPAPITLEATSSNGAVATFSASATDIVDGVVATSCSPPSGSTFAIATTTVTCSATDAHGNTGSASFNVTVRERSARGYRTKRRK